MQQTYGGHVVSMVNALPRDTSLPPRMNRSPAGSAAFTWPIFIHPLVRGGLSLSLPGANLKGLAGVKETTHGPNPKTPQQP